MAAWLTEAGEHADCPSFGVTDSQYAIWQGHTFNETICTTDTRR